MDNLESAVHKTKTNDMDFCMPCDKDLHRYEQIKNFLLDAKGAGFRARIGFECAPKSARQYSKGINVFWGNGFPITCELKPRLYLRPNRTLSGRMLTRDCPTLGPETLRTRVPKGRH